MSTLLKDRQLSMCGTYPMVLNQRATDKTTRKIEKRVDHCNRGYRDNWQRVKGGGIHTSRSAQYSEQDGEPR